MNNKLHHNVVIVIIIIIYNRFKVKNLQSQMK